MSVRTRKPRYELIVTGVVFFLAVVYFTLGAVTSFFRQSAANRTFVPVSATVVSAEVIDRGGNRTTHGVSFTPRIVYRYTVGGKVYQSERYFFTGQGWRDRPSAQAVVDRYAQEKTVRAFVDPRHPAEAVLDPSKPSARMFLFLAPIVVFAGVMVYLGVRGGRFPSR